MVNVLLLREPAEASPDRYEEAFSSAGYHPISIPVLETVHTNLEALRSMIRGGPNALGVSGVVITSKRSCDAWGEALQMLRGEGAARPVSEVASWCTVPFYVVGESTASTLKSAFAEYADLGLTTPDVRGQGSGNAATLGPFMLQDLKERPTTLLYLTGDKNRDTLPSILEGGGISLLSLQVYMTQGSSTFGSTLEDRLKGANDDNWWIIYFAPSAADFATPILHEKFQLDAEKRHIARTLWTGAIGPTTESFLRDTLGIKVHAMAHKPTPGDIVAAVRGFHSP